MLEPDARGGKNWVLGVTALASFMMALDGQVITTAFATIRDEFGASIETLQWTVNGQRVLPAVDRDLCGGRSARASLPQTRKGLGDVSEPEMNRRLSSHQSGILTIR
jgi:hypothetical protein